MSARARFLSASVGSAWATPATSEIRRTELRKRRTDDMQFLAFRSVTLPQLSGATRVANGITRAGAEVAVSKAVRNAATFGLESRQLETWVRSAHALVGVDGASA